MLTFYKNIKKFQYVKDFITAYMLFNFDYRDIVCFFLLLEILKMLYIFSRQR